MIGQISNIALKPYDTQTPPNTLKHQLLIKSRMKMQGGPITRTWTEIILFFKKINFDLRNQHIQFRLQLAKSLITLPENRFTKNCSRTMGGKQ